MSSRDVVFALMGQNRWELALRECNRLLADDPDDASLLAIRAWVLCRLGQRDAALQELRLAVAANPESSYVHYLRGLVLGSLDEQVEALAAFDEAIRLNPYDDQSFYQKAFIHLQRAIFLKECQEQSAQIESKLRRKLQLKPRDEELALALACARQSVAIDPNDADNHRMLATVLLEHNSADEAVESAQTALRLCPESSSVHEINGDALLAASRHEEALGHFVEAKRLDPTDNDVRKKVVDALAHHNGFYRASKRIAAWCLKPAEWFSFDIERPARVWMFRISAVLVGVSLLLLTSLMSFASTAMFLLICFVAAFAALGLGLLFLASVFSMFSLQLTPVTRRWMTPGEVWLANTVMIALPGSAATVVCLIWFGPRDASWTAGIYFAAMACPLAVMITRRLNQQPIGIAWLAVPYAALCCTWSVWLLAARPISDNVAAAVLTGAIIWVLAGFGIVYGPLTKLTAGP